MPGENFSIVPGLALAQASRPGNLRKRQSATMHGIESLFVLWRLGTRISWTLRLAGVANKCPTKIHPLFILHFGLSSEVSAYWKRPRNAPATRSVTSREVR